MNVFEYTALKNPHGSADMVMVYNLTPERNRKGLAYQMAYCVKRDPNAKKILAKIHPDRQLFESEMEEVKTQASQNLQTTQDKFDTMLNMSGQAIKAEISGLKSPEADQSKKSELLMIGGIIIISLALVLKG